MIAVLSFSRAPSFSSLSRRLAMFAGAAAIALAAVTPAAAQQLGTMPQAESLPPASSGSAVDPEAPPPGYGGAPAPSQNYGSPPPADYGSPPPVAGGQPTGNTYTIDEVVSTGHGFFGSISGGLATVLEKAFADYGEPNGYILGEEASGSFVGGLRYGEGTLYTRNAGDHRVFWQGPSVGFDFGGDGARVMMLVYDLPSIDQIFQRYAGINGSAYLVGGFGMTVLGANTTYVIPVRAGVGARLGLNIGYLKFTSAPTWNPF